MIFMLVYCDLAFSTPAHPFLMGPLRSRVFPADLFCSHFQLFLYYFIATSHFLLVGLLRTRVLQSSLSFDLALRVPYPNLPT